MNSRHVALRPRVFGVGLNKTGTSTLGACLRAFGYKHVSCRRDLLQLYRQGDTAGVINAARAFESFEDWPWALMYRELYEAFPGAKFVLTTRSTPERWLESLKKHALRTHPEMHSRTLAYGFNYPHGYEAEHIAIYRRHNASVREFFSSRKDVFLEVCWEAGDGWEKLCTFLGRRVPPLPFPHANSSPEAEANADPRLVAINKQRIARQRAAIALTQTGRAARSE